MNKGFFEETDIKKTLRENSFFRAYLIFGNESYLKKFYVGRIADKAVSKDFADFNLRKIEGKDASLNDIAQAADTLPAFSERTCLIVRDFPADSLTKGDVEILIGIINDLPDSTVLVFWMDTLDISTAKSGKWGGIIDAFQKNGAVVRLDKRGLSDLCRLICAGAEKRGCRLSPECAKYMITRVGDDMHTLLNELEKLCAYVGSGVISTAAVDAVCTETLEAAAFDLVKALVAGNAARSFSLLGTLFTQKTEPVMLMGAMISAYVDMYRAKVCIASGGRATDAAKFYNYKNKEFRLTNAARDAAKLSLADIRECLEILSDADLRLKSAPLDEKTVFEECMTRLMLRASR